MKMHTGKTIIAVAALAVLIGCDPGSDITNPPVTFSYSEDFDQSRLLESAEIPFRTYATPAGGGKAASDEIRGANCLLKSEEFEARFVTPAKVALPVIKGRPSPLKVTCVADGIEITRTQDPFKPQTVFVGDPAAALVATIVSVAVTAASDRWYYIHGEPTIVFVMKS